MVFRQYFKVLNIRVLSQKVKCTRNWSQYNENLVNRGRLTLFIDKNFADLWYVKYDKTSQRSRDGQIKYTDSAIVSLLSLRYVFKLPLRAMEGLAQSLIAIVGLNSDVPEYSSL
ncbi:transposase [Rickettsia gravesii]|uniref:transposase n=1 Tax=Rickettsia gravesii TaxID=354585 RepID=UPI000465E037